MKDDIDSDPPAHHPIHYRIGWRPQSIRPGSHLGSREGNGQAFRGHVPLVKAADPRRLDLRKQVLDPFGGYWVRTYNQRSAIAVYAVADLSGSMGFSGQNYKIRVVAELVHSLAVSSHRIGDAFGFIGCDRAVRQEFFLPATHRLGFGQHLQQQLAAFVPVAVDATGLTQCYRLLPARRSLVFLISDFHLPNATIRQTLESLSRHDIIPIVVWDSEEYSTLPDWGLTRIRDMESGAYRTLLLRPSLKKRITDAFHERLACLARLFVDFGREPVFLLDRFDAEQLTRYFFGAGQTRA